MSILNPIDYQSENAGHAIVDDLHRTGFCVLENHPVDMERLLVLRAMWRNWFEQTAPSVKDTYEYDYTQAGYFSEANAERPVGAGGRRDLKEYFQMFGGSLDDLPCSLHGITEDHFKEMNAIGSEILAMIDASLPVNSIYSDEPQVLDLHKSVRNSPNTMLRVVYYPAMRSHECALAHKMGNKDARAGAHTDVNLITLIPCNAEIGLQVWAEEEEEWGWHWVPYDTRYLIVNAGDMLESMSRGYFPSAHHRVVTPMVEVGARLSLPFFVHPNANWQINHEENAGAFLQRRLRELGVFK